MAKETGIAWADGTFSPWIGCTEVSPGCDNCYARELDKRHKWGGGTHWGSGVRRHRTKNWNNPLSWNRNAHGMKVFPSLCDPFDNEVPRQWQIDFFDLIEETPNLTWLLLTKRIGNVMRLLKTHDWCAGRKNVWLGISVVNQEESDRDIDKLLSIPARLRFVSYEPAIGPVDFDEWLDDSRIGGMPGPTYKDAPARGLDWIIVGGESGFNARPFDIVWARSTVAQCKEAGVACFVKQLGAHPIDNHHPHMTKHIMTRHRSGADPAEWPEDLRVQQFPGKQ